MRARTLIRLRPFFLLGLSGAIIAQIVALSPSPLEGGGPKATTAIEPQAILREVNDSAEVTLATGIPKGLIPDYSVDQFNYVAIRETEKQWKLLADQAYLYNSDKLVHARTVKAFLFDADGKTTIVTGKEAKYFMNKRDLEVFGDVLCVFPDGFEVRSPYLRYLPNERRIEIPAKYPVEGGGGQGEKEQKISFKSNGMTFLMSQSEITLPANVRFITERSKESGKKGETTTDRTTIESDHCLILRNQQLARFTMNPNRPLKERFVHITEPNMFAQGRRANLNYGDFDKLVEYLTLFEDVLVKDTGNKDSFRYATSGRADFDAKTHIILLSEFPQVYQDNDTVTGDIIKMHRDTDVVEVEHSNAYTEGTKAPQN